MVLPQLRYTAGACVVVAGLVVGVAGAATASADTTSVDSSTSVDTAPDGSIPASGPVDQSNLPESPVVTAAVHPAATVTDTSPNTLPAVTSTVGTGRAPGEKTPGDPADTKASTALETLPDLTSPKKSKKDIGDVVTAISDAVKPVTNLMTTLPVVATRPIGLMIASIPEQVESPAELIVLLPRLVAQGAQAITEGIIASNQLLLISAADSLTAFAELNTELNSIFGDAGLAPIATPPVPIDGAGPALATSVAVPVLPLQTPAPQNFVPVPIVPLLGEEAEVTTPAVIAPVHLVADAPATVTAAQAEAGSSVWDTPLKVAKALGDVLKSISLWELAALALPGLFGLAMLTGAGVGAGHRQARVGFALQIGEMARFARPGPLGLVRARTRPVAGRRAASARRSLDKAA